MYANVFKKEAVLVRKKKIKIKKTSYDVYVIFMSVNVSYNITWNDIYS